MSITVGEDTQNETGSSISWTAPETDGEYALTITAQGDEGTEAQTAAIKVTVTTPIPTGDVTFDFVNYTYGMERLTNSYNSNPTTITSENVTIVFDGGNNRLYTSDMRFYKNSHMTIFAPEGYILDTVVLTGNTSDFKLDSSTTTEEYNSKTGTWTGESATVKLNCTKTSGNAALKTIFVSYAPASPAIHIDGNLLEDDGIDLEGATKKIHFAVAEGVTVWHKFVEATPATPAEVVRREAATDDNDGFTQYTGTAENGLELTKAGILHYYTEYKGIKSSEKTLTVNNTPTSIREITAEGAAAGAIYDLQGRKVVAPAKGIFIVNGKKVRM